MSTDSTFLTEEMRQQAIGVEGKPTVYEVERGAIIKFAEAIGDENPFFNEDTAARKGQYGGLVAPPTFLRCAISSKPDIPFDVPFDRRLDGGSEWEYFQPIRPKDRITTVSRISDLVERQGRLGAMIITTVVTTYTNQFNELAATQTTTSLCY